MRLFEIDDDTNQVKLNKPWVQLVPEFAALLKRDKGSKGDSEGRYKLKATKELTFIFFMIDFASPLRDWEEDEKYKESLYYAGLVPEEIDEAVLVAKKKYKELFLKSARSLRTYNALQKTLDEMDSYFEDVDLTATDKKGELVNDPGSVITAAKKMDELYTTVKNFEKRVEEELSAGAKTIRGTAELGDNETKKTNEWSESQIAEQSQRVSSNGTTNASFKDLSSLLKPT